MRASTRRPGHPFNVASTRELAQVLFEELKLPVVKRLKTGPSTDQDVLEKLAESTRCRALVLEHRVALQAQGHLRGRAAGADRPATAASTPPSTRPARPPGGSAPRTRTSRTSPSAPSSPAASGRPSWRRPGGGSSPRTTPRSSCASWPTTRTTRRCSRRSAAREDVHTRTAAETFGVAPDRGDAGHAAGGQGAQLRHRLRAVGLRPLAAARPPGRRGAGHHRPLLRPLRRRAAVHRRRPSPRPASSGESRTLYGRRPGHARASRSRNPGAADGGGADGHQHAHPGHGRRHREGRHGPGARGAARASGATRALLLPVHDELVLEVAEAEVDAVEELVRREMAGAASLKVPLDVEVGRGSELGRGALTPRRGIRSHRLDWLRAGSRKALKKLTS